MYYYRITKYNPTYRTMEGYRKDEWTSVSDIGKTFQTKKLFYNDYLNYENAYVDAVQKVMEVNNIDEFELSDLEKYSFVLLDNLVSDEIYESLSERKIISKKDMNPIVRLILRENIWAKLTSPSRIFVHFGYDYYMYCGTIVQINQDDISRKLYIEEEKSPYLN